MALGGTEGAAAAAGATSDAGAASAGRGGRSQSRGGRGGGRGGGRSPGRGGRGGRRNIGKSRGMFVVRHQLHIVGHSYIRSHMSTVRGKIHACTPFVCSPFLVLSRTLLANNIQSPS